MNDAFNLGLQVTGLGMGLVFLTLILVMLAIILLDRAFRPKEAREVAAPAPAIPDAIDEVAAIAVALVHARASVGRTAPSSTAPLKKDLEAYEEIIGEVVTVIRVDPGPSNFAREGRLRTLE